MLLNRYALAAAMFLAAVTAAASLAAQADANDGPIAAGFPGSRDPVPTVVVNGAFTLQGARVPETGQACTAAHVFPGERSFTSSFTLRRGDHPRLDNHLTSPDSPALLGRPITNATGSIQDRSTDPYARVVNDGEFVLNGSSQSGDVSEWSGRFTREGDGMWTGEGAARWTIRSARSGCVFVWDVRLTYTPQELPVVFVPGIAGSELSLVNRGAFGAALQDVWVGLFVAKDRVLSLDPLMQRPGGDPEIVANDVLRPGWKEGYAPLIDVLRSNGFREYDFFHPRDPGNLSRRTTNGCDVDGQKGNKPRLFVFPYDWRYSNVQNARLLGDYIGCVRRFWPGRQVDIVTHSMGSLLARRYILDNPAHGVHKLITIGAPWLGAPKVINVLTTGDFGVPVAVAFDSTMKGLAEFFPGAHELLPSRAYFSASGSPPLGEVGGDVNGDGAFTRYYTYNQYRDFLNSQFPRSLPATTGRLWHDRPGQDDWSSDQPGVRYVHLYGTQRAAKTVLSVDAVRRTRCTITLQCVNTTEYQTVLGFGDGTVPVWSASRRGFRLQPGGIAVTVDLNAPGAIGVPFTGPSDDLVSHTGLIKNPEVQERVLQELLGAIPGRRWVQTAPLEQPAPPTTYALLLRGVDDLAAGAATIHRLGAQDAMVLLSGAAPSTVRFAAGVDPMMVEIIATTGAPPTRAVRYLDLGLPAGVPLEVTVGPDGIGPLLVGGGDVVPPTADVGGTLAEARPPDVAITMAPDGMATVEATPNGAPVLRLLVSLDGSSFEPYGGPLAIEPGRAVYAFADDEAGNRSGLATHGAPRLPRPSDAYAPRTGRERPVTALFSALRVEGEGCRFGNLTSERRFGVTVDDAGRALRISLVDLLGTVRLGADGSFTLASADGSACISGQIDDTLVSEATSTQSSGRCTFIRHVLLEPAPPTVDEQRLAERRHAVSWPRTCGPQDAGLPMVLAAVLQAGPQRVLYAVAGDGRCASHLGPAGDGRISVALPSPDGTRLLVAFDRAAGDQWWIYDLAAGTRAPVAGDRYHWPVWTAESGLSGLDLSSFGALGTHPWGLALSRGSPDGSLVAANWDAYGFNAQAQQGWKSSGIFVVDTRDGALVAHAGPGPECAATPPPQGDACRTGWDYHVVGFTSDNTRLVYRVLPPAGPDGRRSTGTLESLALDGSWEVTSTPLRPEWYGPVPPVLSARGAEILASTLLRTGSGYALLATDVASGVRREIMRTPIRLDLLGSAGPSPSP